MLTFKLKMHFIGLQNKWQVTRWSWIMNWIYQNVITLHLNAVTIICIMILFKLFQVAIQIEVFCTRFGYTDTLAIILIAFYHVCWRLCDSPLWYARTTVRKYVSCFVLLRFRKLCSIKFLLIFQQLHTIVVRNNNKKREIQKFKLKIHLFLLLDYYLSFLLYYKQSTIGSNDSKKNMFSFKKTHTRINNAYQTIGAKTMKRSLGADDANWK